MNELLEKLALAKWKEMIHTLNESNQLRLRTPQVQKVKEIPSEVKARMQNDKMKDYFEKDYKVHDYERELVGLERGSDEIVRKISPDTKIVREIEDIDDAAEAVAQKHVDVIGTHSKEEVKAIIKEHLAEGDAAFSAMQHGFLVSRDDISFISKGNLSEAAFKRGPTNIDRDWNKYVNKERSLEQLYSDALSIRHEVDELRSTIKNRLNRMYITDKRTNTAEGVADLTGTEFIPNISSNHSSPEVLFREGANVALAPKATQDAYKKMRVDTNETSLIPEYGVRAVVDKKQVRDTVKKTMKDNESYLKNNKWVDTDKQYFVKPIPLGPVKQSSLRTRYLEKLAHI